MVKPLLMLVGVAGVAGTAFATWQGLGESAAPPLAVALQSGPTVEGQLAPAPAAKSIAPARSASAANKKGGGGAGPPVTIAVSQLSNMPIVLSAPGTVEAMATVAIKSRVDGQIVEVGFKEGDMVEAGSVLYRLDDRLVRAQIKQAEAQIARDEAALKDAVSIMERRDALFLKRYASEAAAETARQQVEVLRAGIDAGRAVLDMQRTQLDYLTIRAPITGRTGSMAVKLGAFVRSADLIAIVTINQTKPITVAFALPQYNLQQLKTAMETRAQAKVTVAGTKPTEVSGLLNFVDNQIDKTTGTVTAKVMVENAREELWPGQAVTVDLTVETRRNIVTVPASAVLPAQQGMIIWVVDTDNKVSVRTVVQDRVIDQTAFIASGLKPGERVVTDGQLRLAPGVAVSIRNVPPGSGAGPSAGGSGG